MSTGQALVVLSCNVLVASRAPVVGGCYALSVIVLFAGRQTSTDAMEWHFLRIPAEPGPDYARLGPKRICSRNPIRAAEKAIILGAPLLHLAQPSTPDLGQNLTQEFGVFSNEIVFDLEVEPNFNRRFNRQFK